MSVENLQEILMLISKGAVYGALLTGAFWAVGYTVALILGIFKQGL